MNAALISHARHHPLRFLVYLEWILLLTIALSEMTPFFVYQLPRFSWLNWLGLGLFALMGLRIPRSGLSKGLYTGLEILLILLVSLVGGIRLYLLLYIVLVIRSCFMFRQCTGLLVTGIAFLLSVLTQTYRFQHLTLPMVPVDSGWLRIIWFSSLLLAGLVLFFLQFLANAVLLEKQSREQLAIANEKLRQYALQVETLATVQERNRIAREIHDSLGHSLTAFNLHLEAALRLWQSQPDEAQQLLLAARQLGTAALRDVRQSVATLRSDPLQNQSLEAAIAALAKDFERTIGLLPQVQLQITRPLSPPLRVAVYRIIQEALTNICKYAAATQVRILVETTTHLTVLIEDNGKGFDPNQNTTGFGLQGMGERTLALSGTFEIRTAPGAGCCIMAVFPLEELP
ncbi:two-component sensor histidine kinase [Leptolyngbya sp. 'hensonii']|uniref:sensor histidine kinase n=1 Tax=Leptolyngbya sp. 'hensonii' TaxID=1922337 RepID=UPI00094FF44F|nr:sensor histidine kinase [Leptolyngbya sp. 'hensonii']OLP15752.1 two-component sensor histidine kinase [Leptolyngbya sp. 'hensonii']